MNEEKVQIEIDLDAKKLSEGVNESISRIEALEKQLKELQQAGEETGKKVDKTTQGLTKGFDTLSKVGKTLTTTVTLPLVGFATASIKTAGDFERAMSEVQSISGASGRELEKLTEKAKELGEKTELSARDAAEGMKYFSLAGFSVNETLQVMAPTLDLAVLSGMDLASTCDIISDNVSALGLEVSETTELVDKMAATTSASNTTIEMMGQSYKYVAPLANTLGIEVTDLNVAIGLLGDNGIKAGQAGTVLRTGLSRLVKPTKEVQKVMDQYGITLQKDAEGNVELMGTVEQLRNKLGHLDKTQQAQAITTLFGQESLSGWAALINTSQERVDELTNTIENSNGKASEMAEIMGDNLQGSIKSLKSAFEGMMIIIGDNFKPIIKDMVDNITGAIRKFNDMDEGAQKLIIAIGTTTAVIGPLIGAIGGIGGAIMKAMPLISNIAKGMGLTLSASTALTGGLVALGVSFAGLLAYMGSSSEMISYLQTEFGAFGTFCSYLGEFIYGAFQLSFGNIGILIKTLASMLGALMRGDFKECGAIWKDGWAEMSNNTAEAMSNINMETAKATEKLRKMTSEEMNLLNAEYSKALGNLKNTTADNVGEMADGFVEQFKGMDNKTISTLKGTSDSMAMLLDGISAGMSDDAMTKKFIANLEDMARGGKLSMEELEADSEGFIKTLEQNFNQGANQVSSAGEKLWSNFKDVSTRGISEVSLSMANDISKMDADTFSYLTQMGGSWSQVFDGITDTTSMSSEEMANIIKTNYEAMGMSSEQIMTAMEQDMKMYIASQELANTTLSESSQQMVNDVSNIYNNLSTVTSENVGAIADAVMDTVDNMAIGSVEKLQGMGDGYARIFKGIKEDGSMSAEQTRAKVVENITAMMEQGLPITELLKDGMINFLGDMAAEGEAKSGELSNNVTSNISNLASNVGNEMSNVPSKVGQALNEASNVASTKSQEIKNNASNGVSGIDQEMAVRMSDIPATVNTKLGEASNVASTKTQEMVSNIDSKTAMINGIVGGNMGGLFNTVSINTSKASKAADTNMKGMKKSVDSATKDVSKTASNNLKSLEANTKKHMSGASKSAKQEATNMYNGVKTSFNSMNTNGTNAANALKNNVINATAIMKNSAIKFWSQIRSEYSKTIKGKIEITKTIKENKVVTVTTESSEGGKSITDNLVKAFSIDASDIAIRGDVVESLSRIRDNDTIKIVDNKEQKTTTRYKKEEEKGNKKGNTYITNNYTSPKASSLLELKKQAKRETRKLGLSFR